MNHEGFDDLTKALSAPVSREDAEAGGRGVSGKRPRRLELGAEGR